MVYYVISSHDVFKLVTNFKVHDPSIFSDHCQLSFELNVPRLHTTEIKQLQNCMNKIKWKQEFENDYNVQLSDVTTIDKLDKIVRFITTNSSTPPYKPSIIVLPISQ